MTAKKICSEPYCPNFIPCPDHGRKPWSGSARDHGLRTVTSGHKQSLRARYIISRDDTVCHRCGFPGATEADHIIPLAQGGADDETNMAAIHYDCHIAKTAQEAHR